LHRSGAILLKTVLILGAGCGTVFGAARHFPEGVAVAFRRFPQHAEPNGLDTDSYSLTNFDDDLMAFR
jgi:hypothetical protein